MVFVCVCVYRVGLVVCHARCVSKRVAYVACVGERAFCGAPYMQLHGTCA
jgi:hypothetical protein